MMHYSRGTVYVKLQGGLLKLSLLKLNFSAPILIYTINKFRMLTQYNHRLVDLHPLSQQVL